MQNLILEIRSRMNVSQDDLAKMIGISFATVNRWENGHSTPNKAAQLRLYDVCKEKSVDLDSPYNKLQWMGEEYLLDELKDEKDLSPAGESFQPAMNPFSGSTGALQP